MPVVQGYGHGTGDIVVNISVYIPQELNKDEKKQMEALKDNDNFQPEESVKNKIFKAFRNYFNK